MPPNYAGAMPAQQNGNGNNQPAHLTPTAMGRWSVSSKQLPPVDQIKALHIYDFDNTREDTVNAQDAQRFVVKLTNPSFACSLQDPPSQSEAVEWLDHRLPLESDLLCQRWLVARSANPRSDRRRYRKGRATRMGRLVERNNCTTGRA